jgi:hypothetical protein
VIKVLYHIGRCFGFSNSLKLTGKSRL